MMNKMFSRWLGVVVALWMLLTGPALANDALLAETVAFQYAPTWWQTSICLPDDWQKTLVGKDGELLYDWGAGKYQGFKTRIGLAIEGKTEWVKQELVGAKLPIVRTIKRSGELEIVEEAFAVAPPLEVGTKIEKPTTAVERVGPTSTSLNWASPTRICEEAFKHIAVAYGDAVRYRFRAESGKRYTVVLGFCEGWHKQAGQRVMDLKIEGKTRKTVDLVKEYGHNVPAMLAFEAKDDDRDGWVDMKVAAANGSPDANTILNVLWVFEGDAPATEELLAGKSVKRALAHVACGAETELTGAARHDLILVRVKNTGAKEAKAAFRVLVESAMDMAGDAEAKEVRIGAGTRVVCGRAVTADEAAKGKTVLRVQEMTLSAGGEEQFALCVERGRGTRITTQDLANVMNWREKAETYWRNVDLPYGHLQVPDAGVQALLDSSVRNIYQAREIKEGLPAFQVGPTCYRGLWVVDGSFLMEAVTYVGRGDEARNGIRYLLKRQGKDGGFMLIDGHWKETGIVLWAVTRHARLMGDPAWLREVWPSVERGFDYIKKMREMTADKNTAPNYRLIPAGFSDGGLGEKCAEYTNVYWTLAGMKAAVQAARWLGKTEEAAAWQKEYDDFYATFRKAAQRDMKTDAFGNRCLPIYMENSLRVPPQKAQWAFLHAVFPGKVFAADDPLVMGNMAMLRAVECEGLVQDTGWVNKGLWNYFGSFYGNAWLWLGNREKAIEALYGFANHASPLLVWREEQMPVGKGDDNCGDMPHNWASAEFIRLVRHMLVLERGEELHLLEALPTSWAKPGMITRVKDVATEFGPMSMELRISQDGQKALLKVERPTRTPPKRLIVHLDGWSGQKGTMELPDQALIEREIPLR